MYPVDLLKVCILSCDRELVVGWLFTDDVAMLDSHANLAPLRGRSVHRLEQCGFHNLPD